MLGLEYADSEESDNDAPTKTEAKPEPSSGIVVCVESAPDVDHHTYAMTPYLDPNAKELKYNLPAEQMFAPVVGPLPSGQSREKHFEHAQNNIAGRVYRTHVDSFTFDRQYHNIKNFGVGVDPKSFLEGVKGKKTLVAYHGQKKEVKEDSMIVFGSKKQEKEKKKKRRKRKRGGDVTDVKSWMGPWAPNEKTAMDKLEEEAMEKQLEQNKIDWAEAHPEEAELDALDDPTGTDLPKAKKIKRNIEEQKKENTTYHLENEQDYLGRTYMYCAPEHIRDINMKVRNYIPKTLVHTWKGHTHGVNAIQFIPKTGHLLISASMDSTIKIWDVHTHRKCLRTFEGHEKGVRNVYFNNDGTRFISSSYDKWIKVWDTEYGKVTSRHTSDKLAVDAKFYPKDNNQFLAGQADKLAVQWDIRADEIVQRYDEHLAPVNTITFIDDDNRFVTTSDDKKIFIWDYGTPVVCKHISEPHLHSVPSVEVHPNGKWFVGQSMDNTIVVYGAAGKMGSNSRKRFRGHLNAGYACQVGFSPDGKFLMAGDGNGRVFFWDWLTCRIYSRLPAHKKSCMGCVWHPIKASKVATCSWDGTIKYWD